jgi:zinc transport system substrate-binding protein
MTRRSPATAPFLLVLLALLLSLLAGCRPAPRAPDRLSVIASFYTLAEFERRIGGDRVDVRLLVPPGVEPHDYEPSPRDVVALERVRLLIYNGAGFEPWIDRLLPGLPPSVVHVNATEGMALLTPAWSSSGPDPHVWLDPLRASEQVAHILAGLIRVDPEGRGAYEENAQGLRSALQDLDQRFVQGLRACRRKEFVTTHAAFGYLAARYGLTQVAVGGLDPEGEPSPARLRLIIEFMRRRGVEVVCSETLVNTRTAEALARETGARVAVLNPLEGLTPDEQGRGLDYFAVMDANLSALVDGLDCDR